MEETTWRGHTFTLFVFAGIVVLASIFFILGMLVGRAQGQKSAAAASSGSVLNVDARPALKEEELPPAPPPRDESPKRVEPPASTTPAPPPLPAARNYGGNFQIAALSKSADAEKLLRELKKKGFSGFILPPAANEDNPLFRVQVGPFDSPSEVQEARKQLEAAGFKPILKK
jgi:cell division septation protein DedD